MMTTVLRASTALLLCFTTSCATFRAPVQASVEPRIAHVRLAVSEGRPASLVLRLQVDDDLAADSLELYRKLPDSPPELYQTVALTPQLRTSLVEGVDIVDRSPVARRALYVALLVSGDEVVARSSDLEVTWTPFTATAESVRARPFTSGVELTWEGGAAVLFRRNVLDAQEGIVRLGPVATSAESTFVDSGLLAGGVYAYRVALARDVDGWPQYGPPGEELYVTIPEQ